MTFNPYEMAPQTQDRILTDLRNEVGAPTEEDQLNQFDQQIGQANQMLARSAERQKLNTVNAIKANPRLVAQLEARGVTPEQAVQDHLTNPAQAAAYQAVNQRVTDVYLDETYGKVEVPKVPTPEERRLGILQKAKDKAVASASSRGGSIHSDDVLDAQLKAILPDNDPFTQYGQ